MYRRIRKPLLERAPDCYLECVIFCSHKYLLTCLVISILDPSIFVIITVPCIDIGPLIDLFFFFFFFNYQFDVSLCDSLTEVFFHFSFPPNGT